jgi:uncharacterized protein
MSIQNSPRAPSEPSSPRLANLDVLRGIAIFGIFMVNIQMMAMPFEYAVNPHYAEGAGDVWAWAIVRTLFESNFVAIFSMLFGAGLVLQMNSAAKRGVAFEGQYLRRLAIMMIMGLVHGTLLFEGDILFLYSVVGLVLFFFRNLSAKALLLISVFPLLVALAGAFLLDGLSDWQNPEDEIKQQLVAHNEGPLGALLSRRAIGFGFWMLLSSLWFNWRVLSMLFIGTALMKLGYFGEHRASWQRRSAFIGLSLGLCLEALTTWITWEELPGITSRLSASLHELSSFLLAVGYMGGICLLVRSNALPLLLRGLSNVGRTSLSNYIVQSVVANLLFTFIGFAWFGLRTRWEIVGIVCVTYTIQLLLSSLWLRYFCTGPLEWVWRSATYLQVQPFRR